ncbi:MAG: dihydropteroate synthase [Gallionellaceae bacterium]|nr:dihydropteroate synthase [Gallionellaceae bacterium]
MLRCGSFSLRLARPLVMGIINVTPDSFSDGGRYLAHDAALARAQRMMDEGADMLDIGGESTRPGSLPVSVQQEIDRVVPLIEALRDAPIPISVDTCKPEVMRAALAAGASLINDIEALQCPGAIEAVAASDAAVCLMHMQGTPRTMQQEPHYDDVVAEVRDFLRERIAVVEAAGIARERIVIDPGFGFGKTLAHNLTLLNRLETFTDLGVTLLAGLSRKSMLGAITGRGADERVAASVTAAVLAAQRGAKILRVHDVAPTVDALKVLEMTNEAGA